MTYFMYDDTNIVAAFLGASDTRRRATTHRRLCSRDLGKTEKRDSTSYVDPPRRVAAATYRGAIICHTTVGDPRASNFLEYLP